MRLPIKHTATQKLLGPARLYLPKCYIYIWLWQHCTSSRNMIVLLLGNACFIHCCWTDSRSSIVSNRISTTTSQKISVKWKCASTLRPVIKVDDDPTQLPSFPASLFLFATSPSVYSPCLSLSKNTRLATHVQKVRRCKCPCYYHQLSRLLICPPTP